MRIVTVIVTAVVLVDAGFENVGTSYPNLPSTQHGTEKQSGNLDLYVHGDVQNKATSYSISFTDYLYLQRHKTEGRDSPYNPEREPENDNHRDPARFPSAGWGNFNGDVTVFKSNLHPHYYSIGK